jgi:hypothetical protein
LDTINLLIVLHLFKEGFYMKLLPRLFTTKMTVVLFVAVFAFGAGQITTAQSDGMGNMGGGHDKDKPQKDTAPATSQSGGMGGHDKSMTNEDPIPFTKDMEKAAADILKQVKAGRGMDARNSRSRLTGAADKVTPHITEIVLKNRLTAAVNEVKTIVNSSSPDLFELEDTVESLQTLFEEVRKKLQGMK